jgi:hypothetical protein
MANTSKSSPSSTPTSSASRSSAGSTLIALGVLGIAVGAAIGLAPTFVPEYSWYAKALGARGLSGGAVCLSSMLLLGMGVVARARAAQPSAPESRGPDAGLLLEQVATDLAQLKGAIESQRRELGELRTQSSKGGGKQSTSGGAPALSAEQLHALFRMAASMDQLGAKVDLGFKAQAAAFEERLAGLGGARSSSAHAAPQQAAPHHVPQAQAAQQHASARHESTHAAHSQREPAAPLSAPRAQPAPRPQAQQQGLGLLDQIDDQGTYAGAAPASQTFAPVPPAPIPAQMPAQLALAAEPQAAEASAPSRDSLEMLLSDERVRSALEMQRHKDAS